MAEYVKRDAIYSAFPIIGEDRSVSLIGVMADVFTTVANIPSADVAPVKRGVWYAYEDDFGESMVYQCSDCKNEFVFAEGSPKDNGYRYCPSCGARLDYDDK